MLQPTTLRNQILETAQPYKKGGSVSSKKKLIAAHLSPHECDILDHLQGGREISKNGARSYTGIEHLLGNPHIKSRILKIGLQKKAEGGDVTGDVSQMHDEASGGAPKDRLQRLLDMLLHKKATRPEELTPEEIEFLEANGDHGDREIGMIGEHTHHLFDRLAGHKTRNPKTGLPEYFSLGGLLTGLWNTIKESGIGDKALQGLGRMGQGFANSMVNRGMHKLGNYLGAEQDPNAQYNLFEQDPEEDPSSLYNMGHAFGMGGLKGMKRQAGREFARLTNPEFDPQGTGELDTSAIRRHGIEQANGLKRRGYNAFARRLPEIGGAFRKDGLGGVKDYLGKEADTAQKNLEGGLKDQLQRAGHTLDPRKAAPQGLRSQKPIVPPMHIPSYADRRRLQEMYGRPAQPAAPQAPVVPPAPVAPQEQEPSLYDKPATNRYGRSVEV